MRISDWSSDVCSSDLQLSVFGFEPCDIALCEIASLIDPMIAGDPSGEIAQSLVHRSDVCIGPCANLNEPGKAKTVAHGVDLRPHAFHLQKLVRRTRRWRTNRLLTDAHWLDGVFCRQGSRRSVLRAQYYR